MVRTILHVDLDAFYYAVEALDDPSLRGKAVVIGGSMRGVILTASYEARKLGLGSAQPMARALALGSKITIVPPRHERYAEISRAFFEILERFTPLVEGLSLDEAFLDVTQSYALFGDGPAIARAIKDTVQRELGVIASVGVAGSKHVAKIASDLEKPDGLLVVPTGGEAAFLAPLPIRRLWGIGEHAAAVLAPLGVKTIGDLVRLGEAHVASRLGAEGAAGLVRLARGEDDRDVEPERDPVSIGAEDTFAADVTGEDAVRPHLLAAVDRASTRLRAQHLRTRTITVKLKWSDHSLVTRRRTLSVPSADPRELATAASELLASIPGVRARGARLTGVSLSGLVPDDAPRQLGLDDGARRRGEALGAVRDRIAAKFGDDSLIRADVADLARTQAPPVRGKR